VINALIFEGGGVKGIAYSGALDALERRGVMAGVSRVAGTSAGSIVAMLVAMGANAAQVRAIVGGTSFSKFEDKSIFEVFAFIKHYGLYKGNELVHWLRTQAALLTGKADPTFDSLKMDLRVIGTDLTGQAPIVFSKDTTPKLSIPEAVRISADIPLFFEAVQEDQPAPATISPRVYADGGISWNYPIDIFDTDNTPASSTLGFRLASEPRLGEERPINDIKDYVSALINFMLDHLNNAHVHTQDVDRTVFIDTFGVRATQFNLDKASQAKLVDNGRLATEAWLASHRKIVEGR
jgi:NTE family protein